MLKEERHHIILKEIKAHSRVYSAELSRLLRVSEDTVRRDLHELARSGQVRKVHGGAMANGEQDSIGLLVETPYQVERSAIAAKASQQIQRDSVVILDGEHINLKVIDYLPHDFTATIFTNSLQVASKLFEFPHMQTILLGGRLSARHRITTGMDVIHSLSEIHADLCLMEISSIHEEVGLTEDNKELANTKKAMIRSSSEVAALCLSQDIGGKQPFRVCPTSTIDMIITEAAPDSVGLASLANKGVQIF